MAFKFHCFHCGQRISALEEDQETDATCPGCSRKLLVPRLSGGEMLAPEPKVAHTPPMPAPARSAMKPFVMGAVAGVILGAAGMAGFRAMQKPRETTPAVSNAATAAPKAGKPDAIAKDTAAKSAKAEESAPPADLPPPELEQVLGGSRLSVNALLGDWTTKQGRKIPPDKQMMIYSREVDMIVTFQHDRAIGAIVMTRAGDPPLTKTQYFSLIRLAGHAAAEEDIKREGDGILQFSVGEN